MVSIADLNHRVYTEFPEITAWGEFERREYYFRNAARTAQTLLVDSETGRDQLLEFYGDTGLDANRVVVLPVLPASTVRPGVSEDERQSVRRRYGLSSGYLFYPAQFWPHKNHLRLIEALHHLKQTARLTPTLVLGGSHSGSLRRRTFAAAMRAAHRLGVAGQVRYLGFIPDPDMSALYADAAGLVMPTFFGPTNIPVRGSVRDGMPGGDVGHSREFASRPMGRRFWSIRGAAEAIAEGLRRLLTFER